MVKHRPFQMEGEELSMSFLAKGACKACLRASFYLICLVVSPFFTMFKKTRNN